MRFYFKSAFFEKKCITGTFTGMKQRWRSYCLTANCVKSFVKITIRAVRTVTLIVAHPTLQTTVDINRYTYPCSTYLNFSHNQIS